MSAFLKESTKEERAAAIRRYHAETVHRPGRYARSAGYMDWANQPEPFRTYVGAASLPLPLLETDPDGPFSALFSPNTDAAAPFTCESIGGMLELSLGLSAWKSAGGEAWALRMNPSSGNLHPTECHLMCPLDSGEAAVSHYNAYRHALEVRAPISASLWQETTARFGGPGFCLVLTSIFWREAWKYGERALRYTQHDIGHALAAVRFAAGLFGWKVAYLSEASDAELAAVVGLNRSGETEIEAEHPDAGLWISAGEAPPVRSFGKRSESAYAALDFSGTPGPLGPEIVRWDIIYDTAAALEKPMTGKSTERDAAFGNGAENPYRGSVADGKRATEIIRQRRSARSYDPGGRLHREAFLSMLDKTVPRNGGAPFDMGFGPPSVHLLIFVHRVIDLDAGLYLLRRNPEEDTALRAALDEEFEWTRVDETLPLFRLATGDFRQAAAAISCGQDIAGQSAFSLGMLARFRPEVDRAPWRYKSLFWETGIIGQVLYLAAEAEGVRGTGIGCFFDEIVHQLVGLRDDTYRSLYHFTVGRPVSDSRIQTLPPYGHLSRLQGSGG